MRQIILRDSMSACDTFNVNDDDPEICCENPMEEHVQYPPITSRPPSIDNKANFQLCYGPDRRLGTCMELKHCQSLIDELQIRHQDPVFKNYIRSSNRICGGVNTMVCCPQDIPTFPPITNNNNKRRSNDDVIPRRLPTFEEGCGRNTITPRKIVGGQESKIGAWPWMALLGYGDEYSGSPFKCGGSLVTARHVITAAHCVLDSLKFVRLGEHDLTTDFEAQHIDVNIVRSVIHPKYDNRTGHSDIAILYLERNVVFTKSIAPICLPTSPALRQKSYVRYNPFVAGWGQSHELGNARNVLFELQILVYPNDVCRQEYQKRGVAFTANQFDNAVVCAGVLTGGKDTCRGDSGGPLMIPEMHNNVAHFYLLGVIAYGFGCGRPDIPGVYTSTQYFMDWIIEQIRNT
ncbi:venom protease-like [Musca vetustissima]|uniref:venom protease-like n=1 Tax=Musca vetustissima TaxID=27455 RepID=UPI002AB7A9DF|nr:venom protease-like [Musca vetustissima]